MATVFDGIDSSLAEWISRQHVFFVATAPLANDGHVNCSPKGLPGSFAILNEHEVAYQDLTGSGAETIAHLRENGRIVIMFCAFEGRPRIVRLHGAGSVIDPSKSDFADLQQYFDHYAGVRSIIKIAVERVSDSCGYGVPKMEFAEERPNLPLDHEKRGSDGLVAYRREFNAQSLDGLPALS